MNPLISIDKAGRTIGIKEPTHQAFTDKVEYLHKHFVEKGGWIDPSTGSCIPKSNKLMRIIQNIIYYVRYLFNYKDANKFSGIKHSLCQYIDTNRTYLGKQGIDEQTTKNSIIENKELILKLHEISVLIAKKSHGCFQQIHCKADIMASANPMVNLSSHLASLLKMDSCGLGIEPIFEKLGLKEDIRRINY